MYVDGAFCCGMRLETVLTNRLKVGMHAEAEQLAEIQLESEKAQALDRALRHLSATMKTEKQMRDFLKKKGYLPAVCDYVLEKLRGYGFVDDAEYSAQYVQAAGRRKGARLIALELKSRGVAEEQVEAALDGLEGEEEAAKAVLQKYMRGKEPTRENLSKAYRHFCPRGFRTKRQRTRSPRRARRKRNEREGDMKHVLTCAEMRAADMYTIEELGVPSSELMERAGAAVADEAEKLLRAGGARPCSPCAAAGTTAATAGARRACSPNAAGARRCSRSGKTFARLRRAAREYKGEVLQAFPEERFDVIIDALFGTGFRGMPEGAFAEAIGQINASGAKVVAADIPSGLNGDNGTYKLCVRADVTVAVGELKTGLLVGKGKDVCGKTVRKDIGIELPDCQYAQLCEGEDFASFFRRGAAIPTRGVSAGRRSSAAAPPIRARRFSLPPRRSAADAAIPSCASPPSCSRTISENSPKRS